MITHKSIQIRSYMNLFYRAGTAAGVKFNPPFKQPQMRPTIPLAQYLSGTVPSSSVAGTMDTATPNEADSDVPDSDVPDSDEPDSDAQSPPKRPCINFELVKLMGSCSRRFKPPFKTE